MAGDPRRPLVLPASLVRPLTAEECEAAARADEARLADCISPSRRRWLKQEIASWWRLAAERRDS